MNEFFGGGLLAKSDKDKAKSSSKQKNVKEGKEAMNKTRRKKNQLSRQIFQLQEERPDEMKAEDLKDSATTTFSLTDIVLKHQSQRREGSITKSTAGQFIVSMPNMYEERDSMNSQRMVQVKVLDTLYRDQMCHLVYMQDIT